jgi:hypothetical protein
LKGIDMKATLYEISEAYAGVMLRLEEAGDNSGEIPPGLEADMDAIGDALETKVDAVCKYRASLVAHAEAVDAEVKRLTAKRDALTRRADWLKGYLFTAMMATGNKKLETPLFKLAIQRNSQPSVTLAGETVPEAFKRVETIIELDKKKVIDAWKCHRDAFASYEALRAAADMEDDPARKANLEAQAETARMAAMEKALPSVLRVIEGSHLRIR